MDLSVSSRSSPASAETTFHDQCREVRNRPESPFARRSGANLPPRRMAVAHPCANLEVRRFRANSLRPREFPVEGRRNPASVPPLPDLKLLRQLSPPDKRRIGISYYGL